MFALTRAEEAELCQAFRDGATTLALAQTYFITRQTVRNILARHGYWINRNEPLTAKRNAKIIEYRAAGIPYTTISDWLGLDANTCRKIVWRARKEAANDTAQH